MDTSRIHNTMDNLSQLLGYTTPDRVDEGTGHDGVDLDHCDRKKGGTNAEGVPLSAAVSHAGRTGDSLRPGRDHISFGGEA